jgi:hypothetical protein
MDGSIGVSEIAGDCLNILALIADTLTADTRDEFFINSCNDLPTPKNNRLPRPYPGIADGTATEHR